MIYELLMHTFVEHKKRNIMDKLNGLIKFKHLIDKCGIEKNRMYMWARGLRKSLTLQEKKDILHEIKTESDRVIKLISKEIKEDEKAI